MRVFVAIFAFGIWGCGGDSAGTRATSTNSDWVLSLSPVTPFAEAQPVLAFELTGDPDTPAPVDPILVEGEPSNTSAARYAEGELTETLAERVVPTRSEPSLGKVVLRPRYALALGQRYTLLSREGVLGVVSVSPGFDMTYMTRVWPPRDSTEATGQLIFCGEAAPSELGSVRLFPAELSARLEPGLDGFGRALGSCMRLLPDNADGAEVQPPAYVGDFALEPAPFRAGVELPEASRLPCTAPDFEFGPGCLRVDHGGALVQSPAGTTLWILRSSLGWHTMVVEGGGRFVVPLTARSVFNLDAWGFDLAGRSFFASVGISPIEPLPLVVINEVMANPLGPEPADEWIEIINAGTASATMVGWKLRDQSGEVDLPNLLLEPGALALLVRSDFVGAQAGDVAPRAGTTLVRLASLGKNGLTNSGEALALVDATGVIVTQFPARASEQEGVSQARRTPTVLGDSAQGFGPHASPGASPGASNVVE